MSEIHKIEKNGVTIYPATTTDAVVDALFMQDLSSHIASIQGLYTIPGSINRNTGSLEPLTSNFFSTDYLRIMGDMEIAAYDGGLQYSYSICSFYDKDKKFISSYDTGEQTGAFRKVSILKDNMPINAVYIRSCSNNPKSLIRNRLSGLFLQTLNSLEEIQEKAGSFVNANPLVAIVYGHKGDGSVLPSPLSLNTEGDYVEAYVSNPKGNTNASNICLFIGDGTAIGYYNKSFYLRSNSDLSSDYRIWELTSDFDETLYHKIKVEYTVNGWELFIDGISQGIKPISPNCNIMDICKITAENIQYNVVTVTIHTAKTGNMAWGGYWLAEHGTGILGTSPLLTAEDISNLITSTEKNENSIKSVTSIYQEGYYSRYNETEQESKTTLIKPLTISEVGDFVEINARYYGDIFDGVDVYKDKLNLLHNDSISSFRFGWYNQNSFWLRKSSTYVQWQNLPVNCSNFNKIRVEITSEGFELFINGSSMGVKPIAESGGLTFTSIVTGGEMPQKYDIQYFKLHNTEGDFEINPLAIYSGSKNVRLLILDEDNDGEEKTLLPSMYVIKTASEMNVYVLLNGNFYICYPFRHRQKAYEEGVYDTFYDNWGIGAVSICSYSNKKFIKIADLFVTGEAECAINAYYEYGGNSGFLYVGGEQHGFDMIKTGENGREITFLIDNVKCEESEEFEKECKNIRIYQCSDLYQAYTYTNPFAKLNKEWEFTPTAVKIKTTAKFVRSVEMSMAMFGMMCVHRHYMANESNPYLTSKAIKDNEPFKVYEVVDGWTDLAENNTLKYKDKDCSCITEYGEKGLGFSMKIVEQKGTGNGGMFVTTNGGVYNKIYNDLTGSYTPEINEEIYSIIEWSILGEFIE